MIKFSKIKYFISSNINYYKYTFPKILPSILKTVSKKNIILTISGCEKIDEDFNVKTFCVNYNSFEYTSLINLVEINYADCDYAFLLHDTMICGKMFYKLSNNIDVKSNVCLAHKKGWCNLGAYNLSFLHENKDKLISLKNINKNEAIKLEGKIFKYHSFYKNPKAILLNNFEKSPYGGTSRCLCRFESVDVLKYGSNDSSRFSNGIINNRL